MRPESLDFLHRLLDAGAPSGFEAPAARIWRDEAAGFAERTEIDATGNAIASVGVGNPVRVLLAGHIDEIGLMVTHVDEHGLLFFDTIGGWDSQVLVGQRIRVLGAAGPVIGVIGKKPIHLMKPDEREKVSKVEDLWIDVGANDPDQVRGLGIRVGDAAVIDGRPVELANGRIASRSVDNRVGAWTVLEALRLLAASPGELQAEVHAVATAQEEIGYHGGGARTGAFALQPHVAVVVDVTFASDVPGVEKKQVGDHKLGGGPVLTRGSAVHPRCFDLLAEAAEAEGIAYTVEARPKYTSTDADGIHVSRGGVPTAGLSIPNRYMHSPNEVVALSDLDGAARLLAAFCRRLSPDLSFRRD